MTLNKHITRDFNANHTNRIRYDDDKFRIEIFKYDKTKEQIYTLNNGSISPSSNTVTAWFDGMSCYKSKDKNKNMVLKFIYKSDKPSDNFRLECLYSNTYYKGTDLKKDPKSTSNVAGAKITINGEEIKTNISDWINNDANYSRHYAYVSLEEGDNEIVYSFNPNMVFFALAVKKYDIWSASRIKNQNISNDKLNLISADVSHTNVFGISTMKCDFMYYHGLDEKLEPTNVNANRSGFVFDYRDEINLYVYNTNNIEEQVFGGYISTCTVNDDLTVLSLECADRMIDLDRRYCLSEIDLKGHIANKNLDYINALDFYKNYKNYSDAINFLLLNAEIPFKNNIKLGKSIVKRNEHKLATYGKSSYKPKNPKNMNFTSEKNYVTLRNGADRLKPQSIVIYDAGNKKICLNDYPNLFINYGLGKEEKQKTVKQTETVTINKGVSKTVAKYADDTTKATGNKAVKALFTEVANNIKTTDTKGFNKTPNKVKSDKKGNDCCKTELLLDMCNHKGVTNLQYVYVQNKTKKRGHVFAKINGKIVDPSIKSGWGNYRGQSNCYYGCIKNATITNYPTKPKI